MLCFVSRRSHFHPSVCHFADSLMGPEHAVGYAGDPLVDFSNKAFLDRFAFKNPKIKTGDQDAKGAGGLSKVPHLHRLDSTRTRLCPSIRLLPSALPPFYASCLLLCGLGGGG
jgi:hypothetical protein